MNPKNIVLAVALLGGLLSTTASATTIDAHNKTIANAHLTLPAPAKIVNPVDLPYKFQGALVILSLTIDEMGTPHDIKVVSRGDGEASKSLVAAVSQWKFTPGLVDGIPVTTKVTLPIELKGA